jgi:hypothetical protein
MCPPVDETPVNGTNGTNGHANGSSNGTNGTNGNHDGYSAITTSQNPHPTHASPYKPVGDFLSNVSRFSTDKPNRGLAQPLMSSRDHRVDVEGGRAVCEVSSQKYPVVSCVQLLITLL